MADNRVPSLGVDGDVLATDDVSGIHYDIVKIALGALNSVTLLSDSNPMPVLNFLVEVAKGNVAGHSAISKFGNNPGIDMADGFQDIWDGGGIWVPPTTARIHSITSTSGDDTDTGSGAERVLVQGLDASFVLQSETVVMNGAAGINTDNTYTMIYRMNVTQSNNGANDTMNAGTIKATAAVDDTVTAQISIGNNQTLMAIYQVPAATTGYLLNIYAMESLRKDALNTIKFLAKINGDPFQLREIFSINATGSSAWRMDHAIPIVYTAKSILKMQADSSKDNTGISAGFCLLLVDD